MRPRLPMAGWCLGAVAAVLCPASAAAQLRIGPTVVEIAPGRRSATIEIANDGTTSVALQFRAYDWTQDGAERLTPSSRLAISPAITSIPAGGKQVFRVLDTGPVEQAETGFRLRLNEIPRAAAPGSVGIAVEYLIPVFRAAAAGNPSLAWAVSDGLVELRNTGTRRIRIGRLDVIDTGGRRIPVPQSASTYVLVGGKRVWPLPGAPRLARITGQSDAGPIDVDFTAAR